MVNANLTETLVQENYPPYPSENRQTIIVQTQQQAQTNPYGQQPYAPQPQIQANPYGQQPYAPQPQIQANPYGQQQPMYN